MASRLKQRTTAGSSSSSDGTATEKDPIHHKTHSTHNTKLLHWDDLPPWRRDNAFIRTGYRPSSNSYHLSFTSLASLHNETVNIWSHLLGAITFLLVGQFLYSQVGGSRYAAATDSDVLVFSCFFAGAVLCLGMSATYHALSNHSPEVAKWGNKLDYTGIVFLIVGSYVPALYYGFFCLPGLMTVYLALISLLGLGCTIISWLEHFRTPEYRPFRAIMFVSLGLSSIIPVLHGLRIYGPGELERRMSFSWVAGQGLMYVFGAFLYAVRWPERNFPRRFDIWGSSHQLFHFFVVLAAGTHLFGMGRAFDHHHDNGGARCEVVG